MKKNKGLFTQTEVIGKSVITDTLTVELVQVTMNKQGNTVVVYQLFLNGDLFTAIDNRTFAFYLLNFFDFKEYLKKQFVMEDDYFV